MVHRLAACLAVPLADALVNRLAARRARNWAVWSDTTKVEHSVDRLDKSWAVNLADYLAAEKAEMWVAPTVSQLVADLVVKKADWTVGQKENH